MSHKLYQSNNEVTIAFAQIKGQDTQYISGKSGSDDVLVSLFRYAQRAVSSRHCERHLSEPVAICFSRRVLLYDWKGLGRAM